MRTVEDSVEIWSSVTGTWRHGPKLPQPLFGAAMLELSGQPVLLGLLNLQHYIVHSIFYFKYFRRKGFKK